ncbi:MAG TPA: dienelactone hydrolase family protein [Gemmatimonadaceae bacterium]|nr:dienelactone hydrolase family protein [Gemmatimonadaceae bacterium]
MTLTVSSTPVVIPAGARLEGELAVPDTPRGLILFAHGSGSSRLSPRNQWIASQLQVDGFATLLFDLLTPAEEAFDQRSGKMRFDIPALSRRLVDATRWIHHQGATSKLPIGYFGASTGSAAALVAAARMPDIVRAVVSRGGRADLAGPLLSRVFAPTLLIVGGKDRPVLAMNRSAITDIGTPQKKLIVVPGASHLFEEAGALDRVAMLGLGWFERHVATAFPGQPTMLS